MTFPNSIRFDSIRFGARRDELANLTLDYLSGGVSGDAGRPDNIIFDINHKGVSAGGFGHPTCINTANPATLPAVR